MQNTPPVIESKSTENHSRKISKEVSEYESAYRKYREGMHEPLVNIIRINPFYDSENAVLSAAYRELQGSMDYVTISTGKNSMKITAGNHVA